MLPLGLTQRRGESASWSSRRGPGRPGEVCGGRKRLAGKGRGSALGPEGPLGRKVCAVTQEQHTGHGGGLGPAMQLLGLLMPRTLWPRAQASRPPTALHTQHAQGDREGEPPPYSTTWPGWWAVVKCAVDSPAARKGPAWQRQMPPREPGQAGGTHAPGEKLRPRRSNGSCYRDYASYLLKDNIPRRSEWAWEGCPITPHPNQGPRG